MKTKNHIRQTHVADKKSSQLVRTERLHVRLSPKVRFGLEILARQSRCSFSDIIAQLIQNSLQKTVVNISSVPPLSINPGTHDHCAKRGVSLANAIQHVWHDEEVERFVGFALNFPQLLTGAEKELWNLIKHNRYFWEIPKKQDVSRQARKLNGNNVRKYWGVLNFVAEDFNLNDL